MERLFLGATLIVTVIGSISQTRSSAAQNVTISNEGLRIRAIQHNDRYFLKFDSRNADGSWRTVLGTVALATKAPWVQEKYLVLADPLVKWRKNGTDVQTAQGFMVRAQADEQEGVLTLYGSAGPHQIKQRFVLRGKNHVYVTVKDRFLEFEDKPNVGQLMSHFYFIPDDKSFSYALPLEFSWLPNLHLNEDSVCGDHFFRAPVVAAYTYGAYSAIVPDLQFVMSQRQVPHALDLRVFGTGAEAPRLSYGLST